MNLEPRVTRAFSFVRSALEAESIPHCFIGALAAVAWGRPRATTDVDLVIVADDATFARLDARLAAEFERGRDVGPSEASESLPDIAVYWSRTEPRVRLDTFIAKTAFEAAVLDTARTHTVLGEATRLASPEACLIYKLIADRPKDREDVEGILMAQREAGADLDWTFLRHWASEWAITEELDRLALRFPPLR